MTKTETVPALKYENISKGWVLERFGKREPIEKWNTETFKVNLCEYERKPNLESRLWESLLSILYGRPRRNELANAYLLLLQCQYQEAIEDTSCLSRWLTDRLYSNLSRTVFSISLRKYMDELEEKRIVPYEITHTAWTIWERLKMIFDDKLPEPDVASGSNNNLMLAFDDGRRHLEFEIINQGHAEVFFLDRDTNDTWEADFVVDSSLPETLLDKVRPFLK